MQTPMFDGDSLTPHVGDTKYFDVAVPANLMVLLSFDLLDDCGPFRGSKTFQGALHMM